MKALQKMICCVFLCLLSFIIFPFYSINVFAYETIECEIPVSCLKISDDETHIYQIAIESENTLSPKPKSDILEITENGTGKFQIDITEPGTFQYKIYEIPGDNYNIKYDSNVYSIIVYVENGLADDLKYSIIAQIIGKSGKPDRVEFQNIVLSESETVTTTTPVTTVTTEVTSTSDTECTTTTKVTTTVTTTTVVTTTKSDTGNPLTGLIDSVLTGDSFPAHAVRLTMLLSILIAISTFLFKRNNDDEAEKNEEGDEAP